MITKPTKVKKLTNFPRKAKPFFNGFRFENKYFSTNYEKQLGSLRQQYPASKPCELYSLQMKVFSDSFSLDYFGNDLIRMHDTVFRTIYVSMHMLPVGYHLYFDSRAKSVKAQFFLVNYNRMSDEKSLNGDMSKADYKTLVNKVKEKVGNRHTVSFDQPKAQVEQAEGEANQTEIVSEAASGALFAFSSMLGDVEQRKAFERALKGLPMAKAKEMLNNINALIELNGDSSIPKLTMPKKATGQAREKQITPINKREAENLTAFLAIDEFL